MRASVNPSSSHSGNLGGEVLALELNVDFSAAGFTEGSGGPFGNLQPVRQRHPVRRNVDFRDSRGRQHRRWATAGCRQGSIRTLCATCSISSTTRLTTAHPHGFAQNAPDRRSLSVKLSRIRNERKGRPLRAGPFSSFASRLTDRLSDRRSRCAADGRLTMALAKQRPRTVCGGDFQHGQREFLAHPVA